MTKGIVHKKIEALVNDNLKGRQQFLEALNDWKQDYVQILTQYVGLTESEARFLRTNWYNTQGWWQSLQPVEPVVRQSLIKALELATERNVSIDCYHMVCCEDTLHVILACSKQQVTRLLVTPPMPTAAQAATKEAIWTVKRSSGTERLGEDTPAGVVEFLDVEHQVVTIQAQTRP
jgi:hypothetical protein